MHTLIVFALTGILSVSSPIRAWLSLSASDIINMLLFVEMGIACAALGAFLAQRPRADLIQWGISAALMMLISIVLALIATSTYFLPAPGSQPTAMTGASNAFPSHHALIAAIFVAGLFLLNRRAAVGLAGLAILIDSLLVLGQFHNAQDVVASCIFVIGATWAVVLLRPILLSRLTIRLQAALSTEKSERSRRLH